VPITGMIRALRRYDKILYENKTIILMQSTSLDIFVITHATFIFLESVFVMYFFY